MKPRTKTSFNIELPFALARVIDYSISAGVGLDGAIL